MAPGFHLHRHSLNKPSSPSTHMPRNAALVTATDKNVAPLSSHEAQQEAKKHQQRQHLAETCAVAAGAFALHERRAAKKHPEQEERHKMQEHIAIAVAAGAGVVAAHEKHEKKAAHKQAKYLRRHKP